MHWEMASVIAQSRDRQLEREAAGRRRIRKDAAASSPIDTTLADAPQLSLNPKSATDKPPECRSDAA